MYAPIVLFIYNRPEHTRKTIQALAANQEARDSVLFVFADGPKTGASGETLQQIEETRNVIKSASGFKEIRLEESPENKGLANAVIYGTSKISSEYGRVITLEDDVLVSKYFLKYMNVALKRYHGNENIYMVAGYTFPYSRETPAHNSFFLPVTTTQAWGTWQRAWKHFDAAATGYKELKENEQLKKDFNLDNSYNYSQALINQMESRRINSWAIRWWWTVFRKKGLVLFPDKSLVKNIGWDGSGTHSGSDNPYVDKNWDANYFISSFPEKIEANEQQEALLKKYLKNVAHLQGAAVPVSTKSLLQKLVAKFKN
jgi:hypothetical protein